MKKIFFTLIIFCSVFHLMGQAGDGLQMITEGGNTGWRLFGSNPNNYGDVGDNAVDLSISDLPSLTNGATGDYSFAMGIYTRASAFASTAMGVRTTASGNHSIAMGENTTASGSASTATGSITTASGFYSTALGRLTTASGTYSTAMGLGTTASGNHSTAMGRITNASGYGTTAIGAYNTINNNANPTTFDLSNRAFVIGNGTDTNLSDAFTVLFDGTTTIEGSVTASSFIGNGSALTDLPVVGLDRITEGFSSGWRLAGVGADNYGEIGSNAVDFSISTSSSSTRGATGGSSTAMGSSTTASGDYSTAMGNSTIASGFSSVAMGRETTASGSRSTAMGESTTASGFYSTAMGESTTASASFSTAMGRSTTASGSSSTAMGNATTASASYSTAMGNATTASASYSTAMGNATTASASYSTAMGNATTASGFGTTAIGTYNTLNNDANSTSFDLSNRALVIGNGIDDSNLSDALTVLFDGTTAIAGSITAPAFIGNGSALTDLPVVGLDQITEGANTGWRLAASSSDNFGDIGSNAVDLSVSNLASATRGATGESSTAMGDGTTASGISSTAIGNQTIASGNFATAMGSKTEALGDFSTSTGFTTFASGDFSLSSGIETMASGDFSSASGIQTIASGFGTVAIGSNNTTYSKASPTAFDPVNRAFVIGNGPDGSNRSDAFTVYFDGTATLAGDLTVHSDRRLKTNITSLGSTLASLRLLDGKKYHMKSDEEQSKIGLLAQDVQKVFPELVKEANDEAGTLSLNYQGLIPVLINAVNEQQELIEAQDTKLEEQEGRSNQQQEQIDELREHEITLQNQIKNYQKSVEDLQKKTAIQEAQISKLTKIMKQLISEK